MTDIPIYSPDGSHGTIPEEYKEAALAQGYSEKPPVSDDWNDTQETSELGKAIRSPGAMVATVPLIDAITGKEKLFSEEEANKRVASGSHTIPDYVKDVRVINLEDNSSGTIPREYAQQATDNGGFRLETNRDIQITQAKKDLEESGGVLPLKYLSPKGTPEGLRKLGQNIDVGLHTIFGDPADIPELREWNDTQGGVPQDIKDQAKLQYEKEHPLGNIGGEVAKTYVQAEAANFGAAAVGLKGLAKAVVSSAVAFGGENALHDLIDNKDPLKAAEDLAIWGTIGGVTHGVVSWAGKAAIKAAEPMAKEALEALEQRASEGRTAALEDIAKSIGIKPSQVGNVDRKSVV